MRNIYTSKFNMANAILRTGVLSILFLFVEFGALSAQTLIITPPSSTICNGTSIVLTVPASGSNYVWSPSTGLNTTTGDIVIASPTIITTYTVTGLDSLGHVVSGSDTITVIPRPNKPSVTAHLDTLVSSASTNNQWYVNDSLISGATMQSIIITPTTNECYSVTVTNPANGCSNSDTLCVHLLSLTVLPNIVTICSGTGQVLTAGPYFPGATYTWSPSTGLSATTGDTVVSSPTVTTSYTVAAYGTDSSGYFIGDYTFTVTVFPQPNKPTIILHVDTLFSSSATNNQWYRNDSLITGATQNYYIALINGCYTVTITNLANGCIATSDSICVGPSYTLNIQPQSPTICAGESVVLYVPASGSNYTWSPSTSLNSSTGDSVVAIPTVTTTYTVTGLDSSGKSVIGIDVVNVLPVPDKPNFITVHYDTLFSSDTIGNQWFVNDTLIHGATKWFYIATTHGWYYDEVDGCNSTKFDSVYIGAPGNLVWPGDANDDLVVNNNDLISIGLYYGDTGPVRDSVSNTWVGQSSTDWNSLQYDGIDKKYADCNGDGIINSDDTLAIVTNFGLTHMYYSPGRSTESLKGLIPLTIVADSSSYHTGSMVHASILLGTSSTIASDIYGLAYNINLDNSIVQPGTLVFKYDNTSFFGTKNLYVITVTNVNTSGVQTAVTGIDHINRTGYGKIGDLYFVLNTNQSNIQQALSIGSYTAVDDSGNQKALLPVNDTLSVNTGIAQLAASNNKLLIYPNPSSGVITLSSTNSIDQIKVADMLGQLIYESQPKQVKTNLELQNEGMYFVTVISGNETTIEKIVITR